MVKDAAASCDGCLRGGFLGDRDGLSPHRRGSGGPRRIDIALRQRCRLTFTEVNDLSMDVGVNGELRSIRFYRRLLEGRTAVSRAGRGRVGRRLGSRPPSPAPSGILRHRAASRDAAARAIRLHDSGDPAGVAAAHPGRRYPRRHVARARRSRGTCELSRSGRKRPTRRCPSRPDTTPTAHSPASPKRTRPPAMQEPTRLGVKVKL
jgi:hypothetical protein